VKNTTTARKRLGGSGLAAIRPGIGRCPHSSAPARCITAGRFLARLALKFQNRLEACLPGQAGSLSSFQDPAGRLQMILDSRVSVNPFQYYWTSGANLVDHIAMPSGAVQQKKYDQGGRLTGISMTSGSAVNSLAYSYNVLSLRKKNKGTDL